MLYYKPWYLVGNSWIYAVPWAHIDGKSRGYDYHTSYWSQYVTSESQVESPLTLTLSGWYNPSTLKGRINVHLVNSDSQAQRNSHFRYALTESGLHFNAPNGERLFNQVLRRYYSNGPDTLWMQDGDTVTIAGNATLDRGVDFWTRPSWDADSCQLVVFVQQDTLLSDSSRPILQGAKVWLRELSQTGVEYGKPAELNPGEVVLAQNRSNPFRETSEIKFSLPKAGDVCLALYDVQGRLVRKLVERIEQAGTHSITVSGLGSGVYFYRLEFGTASLTRRMVVAK